MSDRRPRTIYAAKSNGRVVYVGQTLDFRRRVHQHRQRHPWAARGGVHFVKVAEVWGSEQADEIELRLISEHSPEHNSQHTGQPASVVPVVEDTDQLMSVADVASLVGVSKHTIYTYITKGHIQPVGRVADGSPGRPAMRFDRADAIELAHRFKRRAA